MPLFTRFFSAAVVAGLGPALSSSAVEIQATLSDSDSFEVFGGDTPSYSSFTDGNANRIRTYVNDTTGGSMAAMKFSGIDAALASAGLTEADIISAKLEMTVRGFGSSLGFYEITASTVNDGTSGEDYDPANTTLYPFSGSVGLPGVRSDIGTGTFDFLSVTDPADTTLQDSKSFTFLSAADPRPQDGDLMVFDLPDLDFIVNDTNDTYLVYLHQTAGANGQFRPTWDHLNDPGNEPRLVLHVVPEPASAIGLCVLGLAALRRRSA